MSGSLQNARACKNCETGTLLSSAVREEFTYGEGDAAVTLFADVPVWVCRDCGDAFTDSDAEQIRHDVVCRHLGRLTPRELQLHRKKYGMSQDALSKLTGIGIASIKRWELGNQIQNAAADRYLRLIFSNEKMMAALESLVDPVPAPVPVFVTARPMTVVAQAECFSLRLVA